jgi:hypothetical protein
MGRKIKQPQPKVIKNRNSSAPLEIGTMVLNASSEDTTIAEKLKIFFKIVIKTITNI